MNLYKWDSNLLKNYGPGDIIVMAETVEQARKKVYMVFDPMEENGPFEDHYIKILEEMGDEDFVDELATKAIQLINDLAPEPALVTSGVVCIRGSD